MGRDVVAVVLDLLPTGQAIQMIEMDVERYIRLLAVTVAGYIPFRKRDVI